MLHHALGEHALLVGLVASAPPRPGDSAGAFTRSDKASRLLHWTPQHTVQDGIADSLAWFAKRGTILPDLA